MALRKIRRRRRQLERTQINQVVENIFAAGLRLQGCDLRAQ